MIVESSRPLLSSIDPRRIANPTLGVAPNVELGEHSRPQYGAIRRAGALDKSAWAPSRSELASARGSNARSRRGFAASRIHLARIAPGSTSHRRLPYDRVWATDVIPIFGEPTGWIVLGVGASVKTDWVRRGCRLCRATPLLCCVAK